MEIARKGACEGRIVARKKSKEKNLKMAAQALAGDLQGPCQGRMQEHHEMIVNTPRWKSI